MREQDSGAQAVFAGQSGMTYNVLAKEKNNS